MHSKTLLLLVMIMPSIPLIFGQEIWNSVPDDETRNWESEGWDAIKRFKESAMKRYMNDLGDVGEWVRSGNFSNATVATILDKVPKNAWKYMKLDQLTTLGKYKYDQLVADGEDVIPARILEEIKKKKHQFANRRDTIREFKYYQKCRMGEGGDGCQLSTIELMDNVKKLGDPAKITASNITDMGREVVSNLFPRYLRGITDPEALKAVNNILRVCMNNQVFYCPKEKILPESVVRDNKRLVYGDMSTWTEANVTEMGDVSNLWPREFKLLSSKTIKDLKDKVKIGSYNAEDMRLIVKAYAEAEKVKEMNASEALKWSNSLWSLKEAILPGDLSSSAMENDRIKDLIYDNGKRLASKNELSPTAAKEIFQMMFSGKNESTVRSRDVYNAGAIMREATPNLIRKLSENDQLRGSTLLALGGNFTMSGPGSSSKGMALLTAIDKEVSVSDVPPSLVRFMSIEQIKDMSTSAVERYLKASEEKPWKLSMAQKREILLKVIDRQDLPTSQFLKSNNNKLVRLGRLPPSYKYMIPVPEGLTFPNMNMLANDMPFTSPLIMKLRSMAFGGKSTLTKDDIEFALKVAPSMSGAEAARIALEDIREVLEKLSAASVAPNKDACRALKDRLLEEAKKDGVIKNEVGLARTLTEGDINSIPPCVIAALGRDAVKALAPNLKPLLLRNMGRIDNSMSIERSFRRFIISEGLRPRGKIDVITGDIAAMLGWAIYDLRGDDLKKFDLLATSYFLKKLEMVFGTHARPCLDSEQKEEIPKMITDLYGPSDTWETLKGICCLLDIIPMSIYDEIPDEILASCNCDPDLDAYGDYMDAKKSLCKAEVGNDEVEDAERAKNDLKKARIRAALSSLKGMTSRRSRRASDRNPCEVASIGGVLSLTIYEIRAMSNESVLECLYELGQRPIDDDTRCRVAFERVMLAKNNMLSDLTLQEIRAMGHMWRCIKSYEVKFLPKLVYGSMNEAVLVLGRRWGMSEAVIQELAEKILREWRNAKDMAPRDITYANQIICGFNETALKAIPTDTVRQSMPMLNSLEDCPALVMRELSNKALASYGDVTEWDAATVSEMGQLIGLLDPEKLQAIPGDAISGLSVKGLSSIPPKSIMALKLDQITNFSSEVATSITDGQWDAFHPDMRDALMDKLPESIASGLIFSMALCLVITVVLFLS